MFDQELLTNRALTEQGSAFHPPYMERIGDFWNGTQVQTGVIVQEDGSVLFRLYAPKMDKVRVVLTAFKDLTIPMVKDEEGFFTGLLPYDEKYRGPQDVQFYVNDMYYVHPQMPAHFRSFRQVNFVEIPDPESEMILIRDVPHGQVVRETYFSRVKNSWQRCLVYLPPQYMQGGEYPVLYLQHGLTENENEWVNMGKVNYLLDNLIAAGECTPFIVVMSDGMERIPGETNWDFDSTGRMLLTETIPFIDSRYRVKPGREHRAMAGLSMGSSQTSVFGLPHPEVFSCLGLFSGFMRSNAAIPFEQQDHLAPITRDPAYISKNFTVFFRSMGSRDVHFPRFEKDTEELDALGCRAMPGFYEQVYDGLTHDWGAFRRAFRDFAKLIFRDEHKQEE